MTERFVAIGGPTLYPESRGNTMPEGPNTEAPTINGPLRPEAHRARRVEASKAGEVGRIQESKEMPFGSAKEIIRVVSAILDKHEVLVSPQEIERFRRIVSEHSDFEPEAVGQMAEPQVIIEAGKVLAKSTVGEAQESDWRWRKGAPQRKIEEDYVLGQLERVKGIREGELTDQDVANYLQVGEFGKASEAGGPGTMEATAEAEPEAAPADLREIIARMKELVLAARKAGRNVPEDGEWSQLSRQLEEKIADFNRAVEAKEFLKVYDFVEAVEDALYTAQKLGMTPEEREESVRDLEAFLPSAGIEEFRNKRNNLDRSFQEKYDDMDTRMRLIVFKDLELEVGTQLQGVIAGWRSPDDFREIVFGGPRVPEGIVAKGRSRETSLGLEGIREWRATKELYGAEERVTVELLTRPPARWEEVPEHLANIYRQIESTEFSVEELSVTINKIIAQLETLPTDNPKARDLHKRTVKELEAFRAFHSFRITMERQDMDPKGLVDVFRTYFDDETWLTFAQRFAKDSQGRQFVDKGGKELNPFDIAFSLYSNQLRDERILMNMVEAMTMHSLGRHKFASSALAEIKKYCDFDRLPQEWKAKFETELEKLRDYFVKHLDRHNVDLGEWGKKKSKDMKGLIQTWHRTRTLHGAFEKVVEGDLANLADEFGITEDEARDQFLGRDFLEIRQEQMQDSLEDELKKLGFQLRIGEGEGDFRPVDFKDLREAGFLESVDKNAYFTTWMFEWSNYDSIRIFNRISRSGLDDDFDDLVFHQNSHMFFGRHIDHIWEFYHETNEKRGRSKENDVNRIWKQYLPGKHHYLFPQNSLMVRWAEAFMSKKQKEEGGIVDKRTKELMRQWDFGADENYKYHEEFYSWMKSVVIMDMIESGELSFGEENFRFSQAAKGEGGLNTMEEVSPAGKIRKYEMFDVFIDRMKHLEYVGPTALQAYLANPSDNKFMEINDKEKVFYSTRVARQFPWMTLVFRAHWEIINKHMLRLFNLPDAQAAEGERLADTLVARGDMERYQGDKEKRKWFGFNEFAGVPLGEFFGTKPFRRGRQIAEFMRKGTWDAKFLPAGMSMAALWVALLEFFKQLGKEAQRQ